MDRPGVQPVPPPGGDQWWQVWSCPNHLEGLTGVRELAGKQLSRVGWASARCPTSRHLALSPNRTFGLVEP